MATKFKSLALYPPKSPNIPIGPVDYDQRYIDNLINTLRLYFNQIDNMGQGLLTGTAGGSYLKFPYISASDSTNQYAGGNDTPTQVLWDTLEGSIGFTLNIDGTASAQQAGIYKIDYSLQFTNTDNTDQHNVYVWLEVDGTPLANSASNFTVPKAKNASVYGYLVAYSTITYQVNDGEKISLWWATDKAYNSVGPVNGVFMDAIPAKTSPPYAAPAAPSAVGSITFLSALPREVP